MKTLRYILLTVVSVILIMSATTDARPYHRGHYYMHGGYHYRHHYWFGFGYYPLYYPFGYPYWVDDYPDVFFETSVVERPVVVAHKTSVPMFQQSSETFADVRDKKGELLKQLQSADKAERMKAITDLAGYTFDDSVIEKLKDILLNDPDADLRKEVVNTFGKSGNKQLILILEEARTVDNNKELFPDIDQAVRKIKGD
jgi:hypothetical protein